MSDESHQSGWRRALRHVWMLPYFAFRFAIAWWSTRPWSSLVWGLPAIVTGLAVWSVGLKHSHWSSGDWVRSYEAAGTAALRKGDLEAADVYFRRMAFLDESSPVALYRLALTAERQENLPRARELLRRIAPETTAGYPDAHYWMAQDLIRQRVPATPQTLRVLEHHLQQALRSSTHQLDARLILVQLYAAGGKTEDAIRELQQAVSARPELQLDLARLYTLAGRKPEANRAAAKAEELFQARTQAEPDQPLHRLRWGSSQVLQGRYEDAIKVLTAGLSLPDPKPVQRALASTYLQWLDAITKKDKPNGMRQLEFLEHVIAHDADNERALAMLADLATRKAEASDPSMALLKRALARGAAPAVVHLILGTRAVAQGDLEQGLMHLEQARQRNARIPEVLNNLAWGLVQQEPPALERGLHLAETALQLSTNPEIHDTLGTILIKLGRHREAVTHLETALRGLPPRAQMHEKLAALYDQLGDTQLAAEHRTRVQQLKTRSAERNAR